MRIYLSGPITNDPNYMARFEQAEKLLTDKGYEVVNPAKVNANLPKTFTHDEYMEVSMAELRCCDAIYLLKGWEYSKGAKAEAEYALFNNYKIYSEGKCGEL